MNEEVMIFPKTLDEFIKEYSFIDNKEIYTNGSELIQVFRIKQWEEQLQNNWNELKKYIDKNKLVLQNPQILDFYLKMQELENGNNGI